MSEENVQGGLVGVKETAEVMVLIGSALLAVDNSMADGKIGFEDIGQLMVILPAVGPALDGVDQVPVELQELDDEDVAILEQAVDDAMGEGTYQKIGEKLFTAAVNLAGVYSAVKELQAS